MKIIKVIRQSIAILVVILATGCKVKNGDYKSSNDGLNPVYSDIIGDKYNMLLNSTLSFESFKANFYIDVNGIKDTEIDFYSSKVRVTSNNKVTFKHNLYNQVAFVECDNDCTGTNIPIYKKIRDDINIFLDYSFMGRTTALDFTKVSEEIDEYTIRVYADEEAKINKDISYMDAIITHDGKKIISTMSKVNLGNNKIYYRNMILSHFNEVEEFKIPTHTYNGKIIQEF